MREKGLDPEADRKQRTDFTRRILGGKLWIAAEFEDPQPVRCQTMGVPDLLHGADRQAHDLGHRPAGPVGSLAQRRAEGARNQLRDHGVRHRRFARLARFVVQQPIDPGLHKVALPAPQTVLGDPGPAHDLRPPEIGRRAGRALIVLAVVVTLIGGSIPFHISLEEQLICRNCAIGSYIDGLDPGWYSGIARKQIINKPGLMGAISIIPIEHAPNNHQPGPCHSMLTHPLERAGITVTQTSNSVVCLGNIVLCIWEPFGGTAVTPDPVRARGRMARGSPQGTERLPG
jgi:hypothetical protein